MGIVNSFSKIFHQLNDGNCHVKIKVNKVPTTCKVKYVLFASDVRRLFPLGAWLRVAKRWGTVIPIFDTNEQTNTVTE